MSSPDRGNGLSTTAHQGSLENPADATMPREEKVEEQDELSKERLNLYVEDDVPSTPLSETGTATPEERAQAEIDTFSLKFGEEIKEDKPTEEATDEKEDDGKEKAEKE